MQRTLTSSLNPVTRKPENSKAYNRRKARKWSDDSASVPLFIRRLCPGAVLKPGLAVTGGQVGSAREKIKNWIDA